MSTVMQILKFPLCRSAGADAEHRPSTTTRDVSTSWTLLQQLTLATRSKGDITCNTNCDSAWIKGVWHVEFVRDFNACCGA
jgi:hypothetical protein